MGSPGRPPPPPPPPPPPVPPVPPVRGGGRLRSLHWEPVPAWRVRGRRSVWAPPTPPPPPLDLPRLRLLFGESRGAAPGQRPTPAAALLEPKRSLAIGVFLKQVKRPVRQIVRDIQDGVGEPYGAEKLLELCRLLPGAAEVSRLRSFAGSPRQLPDAELFMLLLIEVPSYARRLELLVLQEEFFPRLSALRAAIQTLTAAAEGGGQDGEEPAGLPRQTAARGPGIADRRGGGGGGAAAAGGAAGGGAGRRGAGAAAAALRGGGRSGAAGGAGRAAADAPRRQRRPRLLLRGRGARRPARALRRPARLRHAPPRRRPGEPCAGAGAAPAAADGAGAAEASLGGHVLGAGRDPPGGHDGRPPPAHPPARPSRPPLPPPRPPPAPRGPHGAAPGGGLPPAPPGRPSRRAGGDLPAWPRAAPPGHRRGPPRPPAPLQPLPAAGGLRGAGDPPVAPPGLGPDGVPAAPGGGGGGPGPPQLRGCWARLLSPPVPIPAPPLCCDNKH
ncbi:uncharacterized protein LOC141737971 isoform X3 [Larus michahellis]|uniref:uncharacterized protein LOC141737971 isoform X3 n=1 Tax=Larus michahellis TaxID=119627 RepID=UPI003D9AC155